LETIRNPLVIIAWGGLKSAFTGTGGVDWGKGGARLVNYQNFWDRVRLWRDNQGGWEEKRA